MISQIRKLMRDNHVTQRDLAHELGVSEQAISDKFHGRSNFTLRDVSRIADFFDVSTDFVLGREPVEVKWCCSLRPPAPLSWARLNP